MQDFKYCKYDIKSNELSTYLQKSLLGGIFMHSKILQTVEFRKAA